MAEEILEGVYDLTCRLDENGKRYRAFLFDGDVPTLVDVALESTTDALLAEIEEVGITPERLIITHGHGDHIGGFDAVVEQYDLESWWAHNTREHIGSSGVHDFEVHGDPDRTYDEGDQIGGFVTVNVPGHCPDNNALIDEERGIAVMGDVMFGADLRGFPPGYLIPPPEVYSQDLHAAERNLEKLLEYEFDTALVYHGTSVRANASEKIDKYVNFLGRLK